MLPTSLIATLSLSFAAPPVRAPEGVPPVTFLRAVDPPADAGAMAPSIELDADGSALLTWLEPAAGEAWRLRVARFRDGAWTAPVTVAERDDFFVNWADVPGIDDTPDGALLAHWPRKSGPDTYAYDVALARSTDGGATWTELGAAHDDGTKTEHGFVSTTPDEGALRLVWLDGRRMSADAHGHGGGDMTLRTALVDDGKVVAPAEVDGRVCECCGTDAATTDRGPVVVYRDRSDEEVRDISIARLVDGTWTKPKTVHADGWKIAACPVNGPAIDADGNRVAVAWFTAAEGRPRVRLALSDDGGATFGEPMDLAAGVPMGRVDVSLFDDGGAFVTWLGYDTDGAAVRARPVGRDGRLGPTMTLGRTSADRRSGFPRFVRLEDAFLLAFTDAAGTETAVRAVLVPFEAVTRPSP